MHKPYSRSLRDSKIAIIGAGPAGLHMASLFIKENIKNITVFESTSDLGGKSHSIYYANVYHDMGTCYILKSHQYFMKLFKEMNLDEYYKPALSQVRIEPSEDEFMSYIEWLKDMVVHQSKNLAFTRMIALLRFIKLRRKYFKTDKYGVPVRPSQEHIKELSLSFEEFAIKHQLEVLLNLLKPAYTFQGYGDFSTTATYYVFYWFDAKSIFSVVLSTISKTSPVYIPKTGFQSVWKKIHSRYDINVKFNAKVSEIVRSDNPGSIKLTYRQNNQTHEESFDYLIIACPLKNISATIKGIREEENNIFSRLEHDKFITTLYHHSSAINEAVLYRYFVLDKSAPQTITAIRNSYAECLRDMRPTNKEAPLYVEICYQYVNYRNKNISDDALKDALYQELHQLGKNDPVIIQQKEWAYFYHFNPNDVRDFYPWSIDALQGIQNTWYCGSSLCFESIEHVLRYNCSLFEKIINGADVTHEKK